MHFFRQRRGFVLILSMALVIPLLFLLGSIIDLGAQWRIQAVEIQAARAAALMAANRMTVGSTANSQTPQAAAQQMLNAYAQGLRGTWAITATPNSSNSQVSVAVTVTVPQLLMAIAGAPSTQIRAGSIATRTQTGTDANNNPIFAYRIAH